ncbi:MAG: Asp-tRNA(Asn)/Glu-tRNA(Gln) amidotransferase GatCAB subunit B, partial [Rhodospirillaceae bacterium]|nr:Asp-tRNA(Asn)/Glu-tRNA(Gln) amidotransferase GatCAB subunit B [Rhodospirillaceae bacterium]
VLEDGGSVVQETRLYDAHRNETRAMRGKEEANDYRYFPDPDLLPVVIGNALIERLQAGLPELPAARRARFVEQYGLPADDADILTASPEAADYFEAAVNASRSTSPKTVSNWFQGELTAILRRESVEVADTRVSAATLASLLDRVADGTLSGRMGKDVLEALWNGEGSVDEIIEARGLRQISDAGAIEALVDQVIEGHPEQVAQFRGGRTRVIGYLVGQVMKASRGQADPRQVNEILKSKLAG